MTTAAPPPPRHHDDPENYRMTVGEHLEELRTRLVHGLLGFVVAAAICLALFRPYIFPVFIHPLSAALIRSGFSPSVVYTEPAQPFIIYMEVSFICGAVLASPWLLRQLWLFVAAGLYPKERKIVTKYLPLSVALLICGELILYFFVLPVTLEFFFKFASAMPMVGATAHVDPHPPTTVPSIVPVLRGDPAPPLQEGQTWINADVNRLNAYFNGEIHSVFLGSANILSPMITLPEYISMVEGMLLAFAISFQLPLVIMALVRAGIIELEFLKSMRKYVYFVIAVVAAFIIPDVAAGWLLLMIPLFGLYELGLYLAARPVKQE